MDKARMLRFAAEGLLSEIEGILRGAVDTYPYLDGPARALRRVVKAADRPLRIGILGEANSGKSSLANLLAGVTALPATPIANTRAPVLLTYGLQPSITAIYERSERITLPQLENLARTVAEVQEGGAECFLPTSTCIQPGGLKILEVRLPSNMLRSLEILELPAGHPGVPGYGIDAAIWTTVATQAWRESERAQWAKLPRPLRSRSLLAVTFCDLAADRDRERLRARLEALARPYFREICFVANGDSDLAAAISRNRALFAQAGSLAQLINAQRFGKAMAIAHRVMAKAAAKPAPETAIRRNGVNGHAAGTNKDLEGGWPAVLKPLLPASALAKPIILYNGHTSEAELKVAARSTVPASHLPAAAQSSKHRPRWIAASAAAAAAAAVTLTAIQLGAIETGRSLVSNPPPIVSEAVQQSAIDKGQTRREAETDAAAAGERRVAYAEAVAAGGHSEAHVEAVAVEAPGKSVVEGAAAGARNEVRVEADLQPERRKKANAGRRSRAEPEEAEKRQRVLAEAAVLKLAPIMHGITP